jgi:hypothetical protein
MVLVKREHEGRDPLNADRVKKQAAHMRKPKCYTPQLSRELVSQLYHRAKSDRVPMTVLANRLVEEALKNNRQRVTGVNT